MMAADRRTLLGYSARASVSAILLAVVVTRVDWTAFVDAVSHARVWLLLLSLATIWLAVTVRAYSFALVVNRPRRVLTLGDTMRLTLAGNGAALIVPGPASDLLKAHLAWRTHGDPERMATATVIDKITSLAAIGLLAAASAAFAGRFALTLGGAVVFAAAAVPLLAPGVIPWRLITRVVAPNAPIDADAIRAATARDGLLYSYVVVVSIAGWLLSFGAIALVCRALDQPVPYAAVVVAGCAMTLASLLPLSIGGLGIAQVGLVGALGWFAVDSRAAAGISLVHLALVLTPAIAGALTLARRARPRTPQTEPTGVAMLTSVYPRYAGDPTGSFVAALAEHLAASGLGVTVFAPHAAGLARHEVPGGVVVERFTYLPERLETLAYAPRGIPSLLRDRPVTALMLPPFLLGLARAARRAARAADVVHAHWAPIALIASVVCPQTAVVVTLHGTDVTLAERSAFWRSVTLSALRRVKISICVSKTLEARVQALKGFPDTPTAVIGNGIELDHLVRSARSDSGAGPRITFVGRLTEEKGALDLLTAFISLPGGDPVLEYVGDGPAGVAVAERSRAAAVDDRVELMGMLDHSQALERIAQADLVVVPSRHEGFSLVALEAAALGVPCIGTRVGVLPELLHPDALVDLGDTAGLASLMGRVLADATFAGTLVSHARTRAQAYSWPQIVGKTRDVYTRACTRGA